VTLVEMLVTVAILIIIMTVLVQVFQAATGAMSAAQAIQQLDDQLRRLDGTIRSDLQGVTARFTPPLDPNQNLGYFEYGENEFADIQGEDSDDYIRFTAKAPPGQPFTGRMWVNAWPVPGTGSPPTYFGNFSPSVQPVTVTSEFAEIIYFLRNGNLYRRVLLVAPELQSAITPALNNVPYSASNTLSNFSSSTLGSNMVSWQGVNDLSARPNGTGPNTSLPLTALQQAQQGIVLNTLGDLTNREKRAFVPRFANDFVTANPGGAPSTGPDGLVDDLNFDNAPDMYPSLYPGIFNPSNGHLVFAPPLVSNTLTGNQIIINNPGFGLLAFPYIFPGMYSRPQTLNSGNPNPYGWIHSPNPLVYVNSTTTYEYDLDPIDYLQNLNHNPLDLGDNLPVPSSAAGYTQTWWAFPTWRETLSPNWSDPTYQINLATNLSQPAGLVPRPANTLAVADDQNLLPPMNTPHSFPSGLSFALFRRTSELFCDSLGGSSLFWGGQNVNEASLWTSSWEDDLIMTGVRSFDVKAYDNAYAGYADLGWADDLRLYTPYKNLGGFINPGNVAPGLKNTPTAAFWPPLTTGTLFNTLTQTLAHEGRIPPLVEDNRLDAHYPNPTYVNSTTFTPQYANYPNYSSNIGDDNTGVVRLRRVWDSWSTDYSRAPGNGVDYTTNFPSGPPFTPPVYPSYPPPYPAPLRGIQIQIRVVDPSNQRVKSLTIVQDFTDKL
jgi:type II secretory pathway pseudopilin PulG